MNKTLAFIGVFIVGALVMFLFDVWYTLLVGMVIQVVAVIMGIYTIATPEFLTGDAEQTPPAALAVTEEDLDESPGA
jgi:hypothetical protein